MIALTRRLIMYDLYWCPPRKPGDIDEENDVPPGGVM